MPYSDTPIHSGSSVPQDLLDAPAEGFADSSFTGRLVRPKCSKNGLTAQVFGENGTEADLITALNLSQYFNATVSITVAFLKDAEGRLLKENGHYPTLAFDAVIKRPLPHANGMIAQFFAENGKHADAVARMAFTQYLDSMVFVNIKRLEDASMAATLPEDALNEAAQRLTPNETKRLKQEQKRATMAWNQLAMGGFFRKRLVLKALGTEQEFERWVATQPCCHPGDAPCPNRNVQAFLVPDPSQPYHHVPLCSEHIQAWQAGTVQLPNGISPLNFMIGEMGRLVPQWGQVRLLERLNTPQGHVPTPSRIYRLASELKILSDLPAGFTAFFDNTAP